MNVVDLDHLIVSRGEIQANLVAVTVAMLSAAAAHGAANVEYCRGVLDSARAQALSHLISWPDVERQLRAALQAGDELLPLPTRRS